MSGTPAVTILNDPAELEDALLTEEEKEAVKNGESITVKLNIQKVDAPVTQGDADAIDSSLGGNSLALYLDIELLKQIGDNQPENIKTTSKPIRIVLNIPPELQQEGRVYYVVRVHDGKTTILYDMDDDPTTITIETDRFSTYAVVLMTNPNKFRLFGGCCSLLVSQPLER